MSKYLATMFVVMLFLLSACSSTLNTTNNNTPDISGPSYNNNEQKPADVNPSVNVTQLEKKLPIPVMDMTADDKYNGESGGLYGNGLNIPTGDHMKAALAQSSKIQPLDKDGNPSSLGKIGFVVVGFDNTRTAFDTFIKNADVDTDINKNIVFVNGAQDGTDAYQWSTNPSIMTGLRIAVENSGISNDQVQVAWIYLTDSQPTGKFPDEAKKSQKYLENIVTKLKLDYPNIKIAYISSDSYGGYATNGIVSEPYAYEYAFAIKWLIKDQIGGNIKLNYDPSNGQIKAPMILWGPYLWTNGENPRSDGLVWTQQDVQSDGVTLSTNGNIKIAQILMDFLKNTETTKTWFLKSG